MSTANHATCCCAETLDDLRALKAAYKAALHGRNELAGRLNQALAERDRARDTAAHLEAELARGFHTAAPDITLSRTHDGAPGTPDEAVPGPSGALGRPGSALAIRLEAEAAQPYLPAQMPEAARREGQEGAESGPSRAADGWSPRDLADELLTLQPVDPARCNPRRKIHPVIGGRELECSECWRERVAERLEQWRRSIEGQAEAGNAPSRAADGLAGSDRHSGTGEARKSAESDAPFFAPEIGGAW